MTALTTSFGRVRAVSDLTFDVPAGRVTGFLGPNGAGKTTTLRTLLGLVRQDSGTALIDGSRYVDLPDPVRTVGAVLESTAFHPGHSARVHLEALCLAARIPTRRAGEVLDEVSLLDAADRRVGGFSLGMRQRLALASALLGDPAVLVLDEPANGLDPEGIHWLRGHLRALAADGRTVLVSSHVLTELSLMADEVVVINDGHLLTRLPVTPDLERVYLDAIRAAR
ncbi:hypothetical protein BLA60_23185 [Actinophytocola xinjiangensis]|uniref:ABC transporter domain-containing protein n=1 Tax=Actinophytocola xinjiangensis TaxID=485602 RepID=A0A7Z0WIU5_9PSEU|nr:hypothetical protein BLA60_23185 [Actinophytocola xinjiangensis]